MRLHVRGSPVFDALTRIPSRVVRCFRPQREKFAFLWRRGQERRASCQVVADWGGCCCGAGCRSHSGTSSWSSKPSTAEAALFVLEGLMGAARAIALETFAARSTPLTT
ncbi:unnamed protein product, partial [Ectocarpus sp. 8 AP-2014]